MAAIDVGSAAIDRATTSSTFTVIAKENPCNLNGWIKTVEIFAAAAMTGCQVAIMEHLGADFFTTRSWVAIGAVAIGFNSFPGLVLPCVAGDYIGIWFDTGSIDRADAGSGYWTKAADNIPCVNVNFNSTNFRTISLWGEGDQIPPPAGGLGDKSANMGARLVVGKLI